MISLKQLDAPPAARISGSAIIKAQYRGVNQEKPSEKPCAQAVTGAFFRRNDSSKTWEVGRKKVPITDFVPDGMSSCLQISLRRSNVVREFGPHFVMNRNINENVRIIH